MALAADAVAAAEQVDSPDHPTADPVAVMTVPGQLQRLKQRRAKTPWRRLVQRLRQRHCVVAAAAADPAAAPTA